MTCDVEARAQLQADFPGWAIGQPPVLADLYGEHGGWMATRKELLGTAEVDGGLSHTLTAATAEDLRNALAEQDRLQVGTCREPA